jgi:methylglutaconyl-CoA hydratase
MSDNSAIRTIVITNGERNLLNPQVLAAIDAELSAAVADPAVTGIILTGAGTVFCGGLDVPAIKAGADPVPFYSGLVGVLKRLPGLPKPIVAAVNGDAVAGGAGFVAAVDYVVCVPDAKVGSYEVSVGVWPAVAQVPMIKRIGARATIQNVASGEPFTAEGAQAVGLVNEVVEASQLMERAAAWLTKAARAGATMATGRPSVYAVEEMTYDQALDAAMAKIAQAYAK